MRLRLILLNSPSFPAFIELLRNLGRLLLPNVLLGTCVPLVFQLCTLRGTSSDDCRAANNYTKIYMGVFSWDEHSGNTQFAWICLHYSDSEGAHLGYYFLDSILDRSTSDIFYFTKIKTPLNSAEFSPFNRLSNITMWWELKCQIPSTRGLTPDPRKTGTRHPE